MQGFGDGHRLAQRDSRPAEKRELAADRLLVGRGIIAGFIAERGWLAGRRRLGIDRGREADRQQDDCKQLTPTSWRTHVAVSLLASAAAGVRGRSTPVRPFGGKGPPR